MTSILVWTIMDGGHPVNTLPPTQHLVTKTVELLKLWSQSLSEELKPNPIRHLVPLTMNDGPYDLMGGKKGIDVACEW